MLGNFSRFIIAIVRIHFLGIGDQLYLVSHVFHVPFIWVFLCDDISARIQLGVMWVGTFLNEELLTGERWLASKRVKKNL